MGKAEQQITQLEFNRWNLLLKQEPEVYKEYEGRQIANLYFRPPHGRGWSAYDIVKSLKVSFARVREVVESYNSRYWRNQSQACSTKIAHKRKVNAWKDSESGYNKSEKMMCFGKHPMLRGK